MGLASTLCMYATGMPVLQKCVCRFLAGDDARVWALEQGLVAAKSAGSAQQV